MAVKSKKSSSKSKTNKKSVSVKKRTKAAVKWGEAVSDRNAKRGVSRLSKTKRSEERKGIREASTRDFGREMAGLFSSPQGTSYQRGRNDPEEQWAFGPNLSRKGNRSAGIEYGEGRGRQIHAMEFQDIKTRKKR